MLCHRHAGTGDALGPPQPEVGAELPLDPEKPLRCRHQDRKPRQSDAGQLGVLLASVVGSSSPPAVVTFRFIPNRYCAGTYIGTYRGV